MQRFPRFQIVGAIAFVLCGCVPFAKPAVAPDLCQVIVSKEDGYKRICYRGEYVKVELLSSEEGQAEMHRLDLLRAIGKNATVVPADDTVLAPQ